MPGFGLNLELTPDQLATWCDTTADDIAGLNFREPLHETELLLVGVTRSNFDRGVGPDGQPWPALKRPSRKRGGKTAKPLRDTGILMASYQPGATNNIAELTDLHLSWGSNLDRASWHQFGAPAGQGTRIPARVQAGFNTQVVDDIHELFAEWLQDRLAAA